MTTHDKLLALFARHSVAVHEDKGLDRTWYAAVVIDEELEWSRDPATGDARRMTYISDQGFTKSRVVSSRSRSRLVMAKQFLEHTLEKSWEVGTLLLEIGPDSKRLDAGHTVRLSEQSSGERVLYTADERAVAMGRQVYDGGMPPDIFLDWLQDAELLTATEPLAPASEL